MKKTENFELKEILSKSLIATALTIIITEFYPIILSVFLDTEQLGEISYSITIIAMASLFMCFGMEGILIKTGANEADHIPLINTVLTLLVTSLVTISLLILLDSAALPPMFFVFNILGFTVLYLSSSLLQGLGFYSLALFLKKPLLPGVYVISSFTLALFKKSPLDSAYIDLLAGMLITLLAVFILLFTLKNERILSKQCSSFKIEYLKEGTSFFIFGVSFLLVNLTDRLILRIFFGFELLGEYTLVSSLAASATVGLLVINTFVPSLFSKHRENFYIVNKIANSSSIYSLILSAPIVVSAIIYFLVTEMYGSTFSLVTMVLLLIANLVNTLTGSCGFLCNMTGLQYYSTRIILASLTINIILSIGLIPTLGPSAIPIGTCISIIFSNVSLSYIAYKKSKLISSYFVSRVISNA